MAKYFTMSFDDGVEQDKKLIQILKEFGLSCCTFNLNSDLMGQRVSIGRIGNFGFRERTLSDGHLPSDGFLVKYHPHYRIPKDEIRQVYEGFEVASHGARHLLVRKLNEQQLHDEIAADKLALEALTGQPVVGYVYPYGMTSPILENYLKKIGITYTRGVAPSKNFLPPDNPYRFQPTCSHIGKRSLALLDQFLQLPEDQDALFYLWGHGYELDFGTEYCSYEHMKRLLDKVAGRSDIVCCNNQEAFKKLRKE